MMRLSRSLKRARSRCFNAAVAGALFALLCSGVPAGALTGDDKLQFANGLFARGIYDLAGREYETFLEDFPQHEAVASARFRLAECYRETGEYGKAVTEYRTVFDQFAKSRYRFRAALLASDLMMREGNSEDGVAMLKRLLDADPPNDISAAALYSMGSALRKQNKLKPAASRLESLVEKHSKSEYHTYALLELGKVYSLQQRDKLALSTYRKAGKSAAKESLKAEALFRIATHHFRNNRFKQSSQAYEQLLEKYPEHARSAEAGVQAAWAMHNAGNYAEALAYTGNRIESLQRRHDSGTDLAAQLLAEWFYLKANCERQLGKHEKALDTYRKLLNDFGESRFRNESLYEAAVVSYTEGEYEQTIRFARRIDLGKVPAISMKVYWLLGEAYLQKADTQQAAQQYSLLLDRYPQDQLACRAAYRLADMVRDQGRFSDAVTYYRRIVNDFPSHELVPEALFSLGACMASLENYKGAEEQWSKLTGQYTEHELFEKALYRQAMVQIRLGHDKKAEDNLSQFLERFSDSAKAGSAYYWKGVLLQQKGRDSDAGKKFREALERGVGRKTADDAKFRLATILKKKQEFDAAADLYQELLSSPVRKKFSESLLQWLAEYRYSKDMYDECSEAARTLVAAGSDPMWKQTGWCLLGRCMQKQGHTNAATSAFRRAVNQEGNSRFGAEAALRLGDIYASRENYADARTSYQRAARAASSERMLGIRANAYAGIARTWEAEGELENAGRYFMSVAILYDDSELVPESLYKAWRIFTELGNAKSAARAGKELRERHPDSPYVDKLD